MTDRKLSALPAGSAIQTTDLFYSGQDAGGGSYTSVKQPWSAIVTAMGGAAGTTSVQTPTTGFAITIGAGVGSLVLDPAGMLASGTITMPASTPSPTRIDIRTTQPISSLTISPNAGQTV